MSPPPPRRRPTKGAIVWAAVDVGRLVWIEREALTDEKTRGEALERISWELGELAAENGARVAAVVTVGVVAAGEGTLATAAATVGVPLAIGVGAGWAARKGFRAIRGRLGPADRNA